MTLALLVGLASCKPAATVDVKAEETAIRAKEAAWIAAYNKHDAAGLLGQYEDKASSANAGAALITDTSSRKAFLDGVAADPALKVDFASDRIIVAKSGELATSRGHYSFTFTDAGTKQPKTETGNYLTVYRKAADGSWKAVEDFVTPGPAETATLH
jgi:ketosteroid isomerase-like protein